MDGEEVQIKKEWLERQKNYINLSAKQPCNKPHLDFILSNIRSILPKIDELILIASNTNPNFIFCTDTWLNSEVPDNVVSLPNYEIIRSDRKNRRGGGVSVFFKKSLKITRFDLDIDRNNCEYLCFISDEIVYILFYLPPKTQVDSLIYYFDQMHIKCPLYKTCILGDFNRFNVSDLCNALNLSYFVEIEIEWFP